jgi:hypothetical protein
MFEKKAPAQLSQSESATRSRLARQGFKLRKRRSRFLIERLGDGYCILDQDNRIVGGGSGGPDIYTMSLEDCQAWVVAS